MIAIIALRIPAFGYCLCNEEVFLSSDPCAHQQAESCPCCPDEAPSPKPDCEDCVLVLSLDPGDFSWSAPTFSPAPQLAAPIALPSGLQDDPFLGLAANPSRLGIRGSPPPPASGSAPRNRILRL